jgi:UDP-2,3-diacylglucosamine pyrophosphatase LpxH
MTRNRKYTDEELLEILKLVLDEYGWNLGKNKYEEAAAGKYPSPKTYQNRFGSWKKAKYKASIGHDTKKGGELSNLQQAILTEVNKSKTKLNKLEEQGYTVETVEIGSVQKIKLNKEPKPKKQVTVETFKGGKVKIGIIADTHLCSETERLDLIEAFYITCLNEGVTKVYHAGDIIDGQGVFRGQEYEVKVIGADKQVKYCADNYPMVSGVHTYFITGNHDLCYQRKSGLDIGVPLAEQRHDFTYLGPEEADIFLTSDEGCANGGVTIRLFHPGGTGSSYALSYRMQKTIETYASGEKPNILVMGHLHKASYFFIRNIHAIQAGTMQDQTRFMRNKAIEAHRGGFIFEFTIGSDNSINRAKCEFLSTFK